MRRIAGLAHASWMTILSLLPAACIGSTASTQGSETANKGTAPVIEGDHSIIYNSSFVEDEEAPWIFSTSGTAVATADVKNEAYCVTVEDKGETAWDIQLRHRNLQIREGHTYLLEYKVTASEETEIRAKVAAIGPPYDEYWAGRFRVPKGKQTAYRGFFTMKHPTDLIGELVFQMGGPLVTAESGNVELCFDDIKLSDPEFTPPPPPPKLTGVRVNQVGYFPDWSKRATVKSQETEPQTWELLDANNQVIEEGKTIVFGKDLASGDVVHIIDFSAFKTPGSGYRLRVGDETSLRFAIGNDIYAQLKVDALHFYYHQRSGIDIKMPFARDPKWERGAGHVSDESVKCLPDLKCAGPMNVYGGWYDAGDHGKYVVNAGITVWTLLNLYERNKYLGQGEVFNDGTLPIPEAGNGVNDLLDEVRWELEWELRMQLPSDAPEWAGMAFHKVHELQWSPLPLSPADAKTERFLHRPSTAATLNLAANAAQCARVWKSIDQDFADRCLAAAERAWEAAQKYPDLLAKSSDNVGGGPYDDAAVHDEFYWAAVELYLTTKKKDYEDYVRSSKNFLKLPTFAPSAMTWQMVQTLGTISLATVPGFDAETVKQARHVLTEAADGYLKTIAEEGYRTPLTSGMANSYPWGSNSFVVNNVVVLALAYDFTKDKKYVAAAIDGLDYLLGRNPMVQSYVTGYGENPFRNPHHRFFATQANPAYPSPPPGILAGGPNSGLEDPYAQNAGLPGCPPQKCFVDHIESWSTAEIAINWNAPLTWALSFLDEVAR